MSPPCSSNAISRCRECGAALSPEVPDGFCPACLIEGALRIGANRKATDDPTELSQREEVKARLGPYDLLEEIGRGGMGVVYRARQRSLNRIVAVKMILSGQFAGKHEMLRFRAEAEMAAKLDHPNIVAVHESGEQEGQHYFSMEFVQGRSLAEIVRDSGAVPGKRAARYAKTIAEAIHYAHQQGVLHRDLKPSNVLVDAEDHPRITDFGLARHLRDDWGLTVTGQLLGSPNFMSPEQASEGLSAECGVLNQVNKQTENPQRTTRDGAEGSEGLKDQMAGAESAGRVLADHRLLRSAGKRIKPDPTVDVYGIGAILYHSLTGRPPFEAASIQAVLLQLRETEPVAPRRLNPSVPRDLETICLKCLEKESARRYQNASEVALELGRFLNHEPIMARPVSRSERAWRWSRRKPALATLGGIALALLVIVVLGGPIAVVRIQRAKLETEQELYSADMKVVSEAVHKGAYNYARELLDRHRPSQGQRDLRGFEWRYFWKLLEDHQPVRTLVGLPATAGWADGSIIIRSNVLYNLSGTELKAWDTTSWQNLPLTKPAKTSWIHWVWYPNAETAVAVDNTNATLTIYHLPEFRAGPMIQVAGLVTKTGVSDDGQRIAAAIQTQGKRHLIVWDIESGAQLGDCGVYDTEIDEIVFSPHDNMLAAGCSDSGIAIWDLLRFAACPGPPRARYQWLQFFPDADRLLFYGNDGLCHVWNPQTAQLTVLSPGGVRQTENFGFTPDGSYLITGGNRQDLNLLDAHTLQMVGTLRGHSGLVRGEGYSPDGKLLATASVDQTARIWDLASQQQIGLLGGFGERISDIKFSADGKSLILLSGFGIIRVYDQPAVVNRGIFAISSDPGGVSSVAASPDNRTVASRSTSGIVSIWDRASRTEVLSVTTKDYSLGNVTFSSDGKTVAWADHVALRLLSGNSGSLQSIPLVGNLDRGDVAFSPDGLELAYGCRTQLMVLDVKSQQSRVFAEDGDEVFVVNYSPNGKLMAFGDRLGTVTLCDHATRRVLSKTNAHPPHVYAVEFSPDGRLLASCGADASIKLWLVHVDGLSLKATLRGHMGYISCIAFSPDGTRLVSAAGDQSVKLWDAARGEEVATFYGHTDYVRSAKFSRDGGTIYSCGFGADRQIRFYETTPVPSDRRTRSSN